MELSIFVDESGDFGDFNHICPFYIVTLILHEQNNLCILNYALKEGRGNKFN